MRGLASHNFRILVWLVISIFSWPAQAHQGPYGGGSGHEVPTPFETVNQRFELADGEFYYLHGKIVILGHDDGPAYFSVNFDKHPILASRKRWSAPLYLLEGPARVWKKWDGQFVKLLFQARGKIYKTMGRHEYGIALHPILD